MKLKFFVILVGMKYNNLKLYDILELRWFKIHAFFKGWLEKSADILNYRDILSKNSHKFKII